MIATTDHVANSDSWTPIAPVPGGHSGIIVENRSAVPVTVCVGDAVAEPDLIESNLILQPGAIVTLPQTSPNYGTFVWARASADGAALTHYGPGDF